MKTAAGSDPGVSRLSIVSHVTRMMLGRVKDRFDLYPERLIADTAYGTGPSVGWLVNRKIALHIPVFDKSGRADGTWTRGDFE